MKIHVWSDVPAGTSLFDSILVLERAPVFAGLQGGDGETCAFELREHTSYPLKLAAYGEPELLLKIEYDRGRFDAPTITRMLTHLQTALESMAAHPDQRVADVSLLSACERQQLLVRWNQTVTNYPRNKCIHHLFEAQVERRPQAAAFQCGTAQLSYKELDERANQLAHHLRARGVGPDVLVGICVERSLEMAVGLLGILKAGGAYVPLDPNYPRERLGFMLNDAQVPVLLTQQHLIGALPEHHATVVCLDADWKAIAQAPRENPQGGATAENLAYVIYTSGSAGRPKGVLIPHRGLVNHSVAIAQSYGLGSDDRVLQFAPPSFDIAVEEIFPTWITGGAVIAYSLEPSASVTEFLEAIDGAQITVLNLPTAFWHEMVHGLTLSKAPLPPKVRLVVVGGEKAAATAFTRWQALGG
jgi:non-ribosomal peptide synthetase component F